MIWNSDKQQLEAMLDGFQTFIGKKKKHLGACVQSKLLSTNKIMISF